METNNQTQTRKEELEGLIRESKRERLVGLAKTAGFTTLPLVALGAVVGATQLVTYPLENPDLKHILNIGIPLALGGASGYFRMIEDYVEKFRDLVRDIRYAGQRAREYRTELSQLE